MSKLQTIVLRARSVSLLVAMLCAAPMASFAEDAAPGAGATATLQLAAKIAVVSAGRDQDKVALLVDYEKAYGSINAVPARWPALVRRTLVCQLTDNPTCARSSLAAIKTLGGANSLALNHLFEVSRFGMSIDTIRAHLFDAETTNDKPANKPTDTVVNKVANKAADKVSTTSAIAPISKPSATPIPPTSVNVSKPAPVHKAPASEGVVSSPKKMAGVVTGVSNSGAKVAQPRTLLQKVSSRLGKLSAADTSGFFLDALFIMVAVSLLFAMLLFSSMRARKVERLGRLQALQEIQSLEALRGEEKLRADHEVWSEQLTAEVTIEAQKAHADERWKALQHAAEEAIHAERIRSAEAVKAAQLAAEQVIQLEQNRVAEIVKVERLKTEEAQKYAKSRSDQAIDAYDQMAARELVFAHQRNDELQDALKAEQGWREAQELKMEELLQTLEAMKVKEAKLLDIIRAEQRVRTSEARQAAEKLKAAQQAAVALQSSLVATRALKADLERRADEAMRAAELRITAARQSHANPPVQNTQLTQNEDDTSPQDTNADALRGA